MAEIIESKGRKKERILQKLAQKDLPHLHSHKFYPWMRKFWDSKFKIDIVVCPNQVGKSSTSIRRLIHRCTEPSLWPSLWPSLYEEGSPLDYPSTHFYLYPTMDMATREFNEKWLLYLPRGAKKDDEQYGWRETWDAGQISTIDFHLGPRIYFLSYAMGRAKLQSTSCHSVNMDEEPPQALFDELVKRTSATDGQIAIVFTATDAQEFWVEVVETKKKKLPESQIQQVSLFDCQFYEDGTPSRWTKEKIAREIALCSSERQVQVRVYGRIIKPEGQKYEAFDRGRNLRPYHPLPSNWLYYAGIDYGGGGTSHPAAVGVIAVSPEYDKGRLVRLWRGDGIVTDAKDIIDVYRLMVATLPMPPIQTTYDWAAKDLHTIASRMGLALIPAEKGHAIGEHTLNTLFKNGALVLFTLPEDTSGLNFPPEHLQTDKVVWELESLSHDTPKRRAKDDAIDGGLRYIVTKVPWDFEKICGTVNIEEYFPQNVVKKTREEELRIDVNSFKKGENGLCQRDQTIQEIEEWNALYEYTH